MLARYRILFTATAACAALASSQAAWSARQKDLPSTCPDAPTTFSTRIYAGAGDDRAFGGDPGVLIYGQADDDFVAGGSGDDELHGGTGADILTGELGSDIFVYETPSDSNAGDDGRWSAASGDTITDFHHDDPDRMDLGYLVPGGPDSPPILTWNDTAAGKWSVWFRAGDDTFVMADLDGDAKADFAIRLLGQLTLTAADFCGVQSNQS